MKAFTRQNVQAVIFLASFCLLLGIGCSCDRHREPPRRPRIAAEIEQKIEVVCHCGKHCKCKDCQCGREELTKSIVARYGPGSRLMRGDDPTGQAIIDRYCLAECKDRDGSVIGPNDPYQSGWRPWLCGPLPQTYDCKQNKDGTYHIRYQPKYLDEKGNPTDTWNYKGVKNVELEEFEREFNKVR